MIRVHQHSISERKGMDVPGSCGRCTRSVRINQKRQRVKNMVRAIWNGKVIAESENTVMVEGTIIFPGRR